MFTLERVLAAPNSAEATASYWAWRSSQAGTLDAELDLRAKVHQIEKGIPGPAVTANPLREVVADAILRNHGGASDVASRLAVYQAILGSLRYDLEFESEAKKLFGIVYQVDYEPVGRMVSVLAGIENHGLPIKTSTRTCIDYACVVEQGHPHTLIYGDFSIAQARIAECYAADELPDIVHLSAVSPPPPSS